MPPRKQNDHSHAPRGGELRLQAYLARAGIASRRASEELIAAGRVKVNGAVVSAPGSKVRPGHDKVTVDGSPVEQVGITWIALNKPRGYVTSRDDPYGRRTVYDLIPDKYRTLFHVGRLDRDSEGLLLLTNDGELANRMLHPSFGTTKEYLADVEGEPDSSTLHQLLQGVDLEDGTAKAEEVQRLHQTGPDTYRLRIVLREGKKREIRRMMEALGHPVKRLMRQRFGPVELGELPQGKVRVLNPVELRRMAEGTPAKKRKRVETGAEDTEAGIEQPSEKPAARRASADRKPSKSGAPSLDRTGRPTRSKSDERPARSSSTGASKRAGTSNTGARFDDRPSRTVSSDERPGRSARSDDRPTRRTGGDDRPARTTKRSGDERPASGARAGGKTARPSGGGTFNKGPRKAGPGARGARPRFDDEAPRSAPRANRPTDEWEDSGTPVRRPSAPRGRSAESDDRPTRTTRPTGGRAPRREETGGEGRPQRTSRPGATKRPSSDERAPRGFDRSTGDEGRAERGGRTGATKRPSSGEGGSRGFNRSSRDEGRPTGGSRTGATKRPSSGEGAPREFSRASRDEGPADRGPRTGATKRPSSAERGPRGAGGATRGPTRGEGRTERGGRDERPSGDRGPSRSGFSRGGDERPAGRGTSRPTGAGSARGGRPARSDSSRPTDAGRGGPRKGGGPKPSGSKGSGGSPRGRSGPPKRGGRA